MQKLSYWLGVVVAIAVVIAIPYVAYLAIIIFLSASSAAKLGALTALISIIALIYNNLRQQEREIKSRHFSEQRQAYQKVGDLLFDIMNSVTGTEQLDNDETLKRSRMIVKDIMFWGSANTVNQYNLFIRNSSQPIEENSMANFHNVENLLRALRKDLGHNDKKMEHLGLSKLLIKGDEHHKLDNI